MASPLAPALKVVRCSPSNPEPALDAAVMFAPREGEEAEGTRAERYIRTRDEGLLVFTADGQPTWFHLRRLPLAFLAGVLDLLTTRSAQRVLAFRAACHLIEGPGGPLQVQPPGEKGPYVAKRADHGVHLAPEDWAQEVADRFDADVVQEMGEVAITASRLRRDAKGPFGWWGGSAASP